MEYGALLYNEGQKAWIIHIRDGLVSDQQLVEDLRELNEFHWVSYIYGWKRDHVAVQPNLAYDMTEIRLAVELALDRLAVRTLGVEPRFAGNSDYMPTARRYPDLT